MKKLEIDQGHIQNFIQCKLWKNIKKKYHDEDIVLPCFVYHDDFEPDNPLGSNSGANKIACVFYTFPVFPQHLLSSTKYIFEALLFLSSLKKSNLHSALAPLIKEFKILETDGLILNINGKETKIFITIPLILGDNLAQNEILGFSKSFNSNHFCRLCKQLKNLALKEIESSDEFARTQSEYEEDLENNRHGVVDKCIFNELNNFHVTSNYSVDIMHDIMEGIAKYDVALFLHNVIYERKIINIYTLNKLKQEFDFGSIEIGNMGPEITETHIKNKCLSMSASEMRTFIHFFPIMFGHHLIDIHCEKIWIMMKNLTELTDLLMQTKLSYEDIEKISEIIKNYLTLRKTIFSEKLKPKHHFLTHYKKCIDQSGPLHNIMTFSFEQKNRVVKKYSKISHQRINLPWSLLYKSLMQFNKLLEDHQNGFPSVFQFDNNAKVVTLESLKKKVYFNEDIFNSHNDKIIHKWLKYKGTLFKIDYFVALYEENIKCYQIRDIIQEENIFFLIIEEYEVLFYDNQKLCYHVGGPLNNFLCHKIDDFYFFPFNLHKLVDGSQTFRLKHI